MICIKKLERKKSRKKRNIDIKKKKSKKKKGFVFVCWSLHQQWVEELKKPQSQVICWEILLQSLILLLQTTEKLRLHALTSPNASSAKLTLTTQSGKGMELLSSQHKKFHKSCFTAISLAWNTKLAFYCVQSDSHILKK